MNKKTLKLILAAALGLSLLCAAQTVNAMEENTNLNKNLITKSENKSTITEKISFLDDDLKEIVKKMTTYFLKYDNIIINNLRFDAFINLFLNKFTTNFTDYLLQNNTLLFISPDFVDDISRNISKPPKDDNKILLVEDVIPEDKYEKFCGFFALKCIKDLGVKCQIPNLEDEQIEKCLNELRSELEKGSDQNKKQLPYLKTILDRLLAKSLFDYRSEESNENIEEGGRVVAGRNLEEYINFEDFDPNNKSTCKDTERTKPKPIVHTHEMSDPPESEQKHSRLYDLFSSSVNEMNIKLPAGMNLSKKKKELTENLDKTYCELINDEYQYNLYKDEPFYNFIKYFIEHVKGNFSDTFREKECCDSYVDKINKIECFILNLFLNKIDYKNFHKNLGEIWSEYKIYEEKINELYKNIMDKAIEIFNDEKVDDSVLIKNEMKLKLFNTYIKEMYSSADFFNDEKYNEANILYDVLIPDFENNVNNDGVVLSDYDQFFLGIEPNFNPPLDDKYTQYVNTFKETLDEFFKANPNFKTSSETKEKFKEKLNELFIKIQENFDKINQKV